MNPWVRIDTGFLRHPKVVGLSDRGKLAYLESIFAAHEQNLDGHVVRGSVPAKGKLRDAIVAAGLWDERDGGIDVVGYLDRQESRKEREERHQAKVEAGKLGGLASARSRQAAAVAAAQAPATADAQAETKHSDSDSPLRLLFKGSSDKRLSLEKKHRVERIMHLVGDHADKGTQGVISSLASQLSEGALAKVHESLLLASRGEENVNNRAGFVVRALQSEISGKNAA